MTIEEKYPSTNLMILYHYAAKMLEENGFYLEDQIDRSFNFVNSGTRIREKIVIQYEYDCLCIIGTSVCPALMGSLMKSNVFTLNEDGTSVLDGNLEMPLENLWYETGAHFSDEEILEIFSKDFTRRRYLKKIRESRAKIEAKFFKPLIDMPTADFI